jgi:ParB/RepB/Spo0J family partition protein
MGCHVRDHFIADMLKQLRLPQSIVTYDERPVRGHAMHTARKCWLTPLPEGATHRLVLQDDLELCDDFIGIVHRASAYFPRAMFSLYNPRLRFEHRKSASPYVLTPGGTAWGQAILMPGDQIEPCFDWITRTLPADYKHDDCAISEYACVHGVQIMTTVPSTVQHLAPTASLLGFNNLRKVSKVWTGRDLSGEDWRNTDYWRAAHVRNNLYLPKGYSMPKRPAPIKTNVALETLAIDYVPVDSIKANAYNPNRMSEKDFELLLRSMREDGFTQPVIAQRETRIIVDGEHRWRAAAHLGMATLPVVFVSMTEEQARIATLRHNRARGSEDLQLSAEVLRDLEKLGALDWAADSLMLSDAEIEKLLADVPAPDALAGDAYSTAWEPGARPEDGQITERATDTEGSGIVITSAASVNALEAERRREERIAAARTEEERELARKDGTSYRINLMFADDEAKVVKAVLGDKPAERLLSICRDYARTAEVQTA